MSRPTPITEVAELWMHVNFDQFFNYSKKNILTINYAYFFNFYVFVIYA